MPRLTAVYDRPTSAVAPHAGGGDTYPLDMVRLSGLMEITAGRSDVVIGLIDGPVAVRHPGFATRNIQALTTDGTCTGDDASCVHGTFVAGILAARRGSAVPAICPECSLLLRPIFGVDRSGDGRLESGALPSATAQELAAAIVQCIEHGARILNVSAALTAVRAADRGELAQALDLAARRSVLVVVAGGNQRGVATTTLTRHPWVLPVVAYTGSGRPTEGATLGASIGRGGLGAPGERITSLAPGGGTLRLGGSSVATPFVTGAAALILSLLPAVSAAELRVALTTSAGGRRHSVLPPLLDAWGAYQTMVKPGGI